MRSRTELLQQNEKFDVNQYASLRHRIFLIFCRSKIGEETESRHSRQKRKKKRNTTISGVTLKRRPRLFNQEKPIGIPVSGMLHGSAEHRA